jgi:dGTPase
MRLQWDKLLSASRLGRGMTQKDVRTNFQRDFDRIVFSSAFRRLQDKTQVFPLAESDYVRTRLTHSIEVSCVGRSLGTLVGERVMARGEAAAHNPQKFGEIVAAACLAHDIGNPPFGHSGEKAIRTWFEKAGRSYLEGLTDQQCGDIQNFEGNAQGFRVITHLQNNIGAGGLQLTHAVLGAFSKYPRRSHVTGIGKSERVSEKKFGFVAADETWFDEVAQNVGLIQRHPGAWARHPLAFLMEAADDICYRIVDLEDGYRLRRVTFAETETLLKPLAFAARDGVPNSDYLRIGE